MATDINAPAEAARSVKPTARNPQVRAILYQGVMIALVGAAAWFLVANLNHNRDIRGIATGYAFLEREAGFAISESLIAFTPSGSYARALFVGLLNTVAVSVLAIVFGSILGLVVGVSRLSSNWPLARLAAAYVDVVRNVPLIAQLLLWAGLIRLSSPSPRQAISLGDVVFISNRGIQVPSIGVDPVFLWTIAAVVAAAILAWVLLGRRLFRRLPAGRSLSGAPVALSLFVGIPILVWAIVGTRLELDVPRLEGFNFRGGWTLTPEFATMLIGLSVYGGAFIAEVVRGGLLAVPNGQKEAASALGLHPGVILRRVVLPQAVRIMIPPLTSQYLNVVKNSSLAVVIGYPDLVSIGSTIGNQTGQVIEAISIFMAIYLFISLSISIGMNAYNRRMALWGH